MIRGLGLRGAIAVNVITMIGIGPLITIPLVLANLHGSLALVAWIGGALIALCDGLIWAELASQYPSSGGTYAYLLETFGRERWGRLLAFLFTWQTVLSAPLILATGYIGFAQYAGYLWPVLATDTHVQGIVAASVGIATLALLYRPIGAVAATSFAFAAIAIATLGAVIASAATHLNLTQALSLDRATPLGAALVAGLGPALVITLYDYFGYAQSCMLGDEVREPARVLPRSIVVSVLGIAALYIVLQLGVLGVVRWQELVPSTPGGTAPAAANYVASTVLERTWGVWAARIGTIAILITAFASTFGNLLGASRIPYAAAVDGVFLKPFAALQRSGRFPHVALLALGLLALPACFFSLGNVIAALTAATVVIQNLAQVAILFVLRSRRVKTPYRMWLYPLPALIACAGWIYIFFSSGTGPIAYGLLTLAAGAGIFLVRARLRAEWPFAGKAAAALSLLALTLLSASAPASAAWGSSAIVERRGVPIFTVDGKPFFVYGAAFFYERLPRDRWKPSMLGLRRLGINTLDLYVPWNWHELADGDFDFSGRTSPRRDLHEVLRLARALHFKIVLRPGPVIRNEWRNGGYPAWLLQRPEYGMPLHDLLEGRYPPTATLQNAHSDDAAAEWLANATHLHYAKRWLVRVLHEFDPYSDLVIAVALDDDQGAYIDNQTWPAPHFHAYLAWLKSAVHSVTGPLEPVFINTYQMKVTASSPVWAMGNWYQSDAYLLAEHDRAQLEFSTGLLQTRDQPVMISEFQAGWLEQPGDIRPRPADPSNTLLAMATMLGMGARGIVNFPAQDTLDPSGMEAPFANAFYAWDAALDLSGTPAPREVPTAAVGAFIAAFGRSLAASEPLADLAVAYTTSAYGDQPPDDASVSRIAQRTIEVQQACRALSLACRLVDLRYASDADLRRFPLVVIPEWSGPTEAASPTLATSSSMPAFAPSVRARLARYRNAGGQVAIIRPERDIPDLQRAVAAAHVRRVVENAPGASAAFSRDGQVDGYLFVPNYGASPLELRDVIVRLAPGRTYRIPHLRVAPRDFIASPLGLRVKPLDAMLRTVGASVPARIAYTDCPVRAFGARTFPAPPAGSSAADTCRFHFAGGEDVAFDPNAVPSPKPEVPVARFGLPVRRDAMLPPAPAPPQGKSPRPAGYPPRLDSGKTVPANQARDRFDDIYREGSDALILENTLVRVVIAPNAGGRAFVFEDLATHRSVFTSVGAMRDDIEPEPPLSTTDRIAKYTHQFPAGMFNRSYAVETIASGAHAAARLTYTAPDVAFENAAAGPHATASDARDANISQAGARGAYQDVTFTRTVSLEPNARSFSVDEYVTFGAAASQGALRAVSVSSLAVGEARDMRTTSLLLPGPEPFVANATRSVSGNALGYYDASSHELATIAWGSAGIERAAVLEQDFSIVVRLTLSSSDVAHVTYGYTFADSLEAARAALAAAELAAQGQPPGLAKVARCGEVAERSTRSPQKRLSLRSCGFESHLP